MTTIVNNPAPESKSSGMGFVIGIFFLIVIGLVFYYYGLPAIRNIGSPQINVPSQINVNVKQTP
jgi:CHASE3 domain sensor protein